MAGALQGNLQQPINRSDVLPNQPYLQCQATSQAFSRAARQRSLSGSHSQLVSRSVWKPSLMNPQMAENPPVSMCHRKKKREIAGDHFGKHPVLGGYFPR